MKIYRLLDEVNGFKLLADEINSFDIVHPCYWRKFLLFEENSIRKKRNLELNFVLPE